jgi:hypothetical protein
MLAEVVAANLPKRDGLIKAFGSKEFKPCPYVRKTCHVYDLYENVLFLVGFGANEFGGTCEEYRENLFPRHIPSRNNCE